MKRASYYESIPTSPFTRCLHIGAVPFHMLICIWDENKSETSLRFCQLNVWYDADVSDVRWGWTCPIASMSVNRPPVIRQTAKRPISYAHHRDHTADCFLPNTLCENTIPFSADHNTYDLTSQSQVAFLWRFIMCRFLCCCCFFLFFFFCLY